MSVIKTKKITKKTSNKKYIIILAIILVIMVANMYLILNLFKSKEKEKNVYSKPAENEQTEEIQEISEEDEIKTLSESNRMKRYIGIFFERIEEGNYQDAYSVLNQEFKDTYFPTLKEFTEYADKNFNPTVMGVTYDNIERLGNNKTGNMYVVWLTIDNIFAAKKTEEEAEAKEQTNFVIVEKDYNNYEMSFSVNEE